VRRMGPAINTVEEYGRRMGLKEKGEVWDQRATALF
jgi:hypothetical protein